METNKDEPEKIIIDLDGAIEKIIEKKQSINRAVILQDSVGCRVELQSNSERDRKSTRLNSSHIPLSRMPSSA